MIELEAFRKQLPNVEMMKDLDLESLIPLLPDIVEAVKENLRSSSFPWSLKREKQVKDFFALFTYPSAIPHLLNILRDPLMVPMDEVIGDPQIKVETRLDSWDDEGTNGWSKGEAEVTVQVVTETYRMGDPVAEGVKMALLQIEQNNVSLQDEIEQVIHDFDNLPLQTYPISKENILDKKILWNTYGSWK